MVYYSSLVYLIATLILTQVTIKVRDVPNTYPCIAFLLHTWTIPTLLDGVITTAIQQRTLSSVLPCGKFDPTSHVPRTAWDSYADALRLNKKSTISMSLTHHIAAEKLTAS